MEEGLSSTATRIFFSSPRPRRVSGNQPSRQLGEYRQRQPPRFLISAKLFAPIDINATLGHGQSSRLGKNVQPSPIQGPKVQLTFPPGFSTPRPFSSLLAV